MTGGTAGGTGVETGGVDVPSEDGDSDESMNGLG
jgi:hypothetical protein